MFPDHDLYRLKKLVDPTLTIDHIMTEKEKNCVTVPIHLIKEQLFVPKHKRVTQTIILNSNN